MPRCPVNFETTYSFRMSDRHKAEIYTAAALMGEKPGLFARVELLKAARRVIKKYGSLSC